MFPTNEGVKNLTYFSQANYTGVLPLCVGRDRGLRAWLLRERTFPMNCSSRWGTWCVAGIISLVAAGMWGGWGEVWAAEPAKAAGSTPASGSKPAGSESKPAAPEPKAVVPEAKPARPDIEPQEGSVPGKTPAPEPPKLLPAGRPRQLAPGVLISIPPDLQAADTVSRHDVVELLAVDQNFDWAKDIAFRRDVFCLEFEFKPVRVMVVDLPQPSGLFQRKLVWYLVYRVTHSGKVLHPEPAANGSYDVQEVEQPVRFVPEFVLDCPRLGKRYPDRVIPLAFQRIAQREDPHQRFFNTVEMVRELKPGESVWGIATWEDIDPRIDRFSVYVYGLTNAYRWTDAGPLQPNDKLGKGRVLYRKALQLNFWRPGDEFDRQPTEIEAEIRFGWPDRPAYQWVFRPLGS